MQSAPRVNLNFLRDRVIDGGELSESVVQGCFGSWLGTTLVPVTFYIPSSHWRILGPPSWARTQSPFTQCFLSLTIRLNLSYTTLILLSFLEVVQLLVLDAEWLNGGRMMPEVQLVQEIVSALSLDLHVPDFLNITSLFLDFLGNAFTYVFPPPLASTTADVPSSAVKEWNTCPSESEIFSTRNLLPFESTLFNPLPSQPLIGQLVVPVQDRNQHWLDDPPQSPRKRLKVNVDMGPLDELIPLVHDSPSARSHLTHNHPSSLTTFLPLPTNELHCLILHLIYTLLSWCLFHPRQRLPSKDCSHPSMLVSLG